MLEMKWVRENPEVVQQAADAKHIHLSVIDLLQTDDQRKQLLQEVEQLRFDRNRANDSIKELIQSGKANESEPFKQQVKQCNIRIQQLEEQRRTIEDSYQRLMLQVPNIISEDTPQGISDKDNIELKRVGEVPDFAFEPKDHVELGSLHQMLDIPRGVKAAGTRNYYLTGNGALLHRAVQQLAIDVLVQKGFTLLEVPLMLREEAMVNTGFFPSGKEQTYKIEAEDKWLVGTSEVPLIAYYQNEIIDVNKPLKLAAVSACFRKEAGSAGRDVRGLYRVHQFSKVEQVIVCRNSLEESEQIFKDITANAEEILQLLELPYRVMAVCAGDLSQKNYKQYDIETWMPSRQAYGETHSSSIVLDFQARRSNIRYKDEQGKLHYCHTLNNTAVASPRILIPLLENHQEEDGTIRIPQALRPYMNGLERLVL